MKLIINFCIFCIFCICSKHAFFVLKSAKYSLHCVLCYKDKKEEIRPSPMKKAPTPTEMSKGQIDNTNNATKSSIKQQLRTDLGRSVGVTTATQLVWLTWFTGPPSHFPQQPCNQKDTYLKICK